MNILFFLSPKQDLMYVYDDFTLRQTLEKWENNRYASIPVLNRKGEYVGTLTEGDILWGLKKYHGLDLEAAEDIPISEFAHKRDYKAVTVTTSMDELVEAAMSQNFVPVVDDRGIFIGIVRRQAIIRYCYDRSRAAAAEQRRKPEKQEKPISERPREKKLKFSYNEQREFDTIDSVIAELDAQLSACRQEQESCGSDYVRLQALTAEQERLTAELDAKTERWVYLNDLKERIDAQ